MQTFWWKFLKRLKQYPQLFLLANVSITIENNEFVEKSIGELLKKQNV